MNSLLYGLQLLINHRYAEVASEAGVGGCDLAEALENSCVTLAVLKLKDGMKLSERVSYGCILAKMAATPDKRALLIDGGVVQELQLLFTSTTAQQSSEDSVCVLHSLISLVLLFYSVFSLTTSILMFFLTRLCDGHTRMCSRWCVE